jgi:sigma-E factor negative regulatory protein RseB
MFSRSASMRDRGTPEHDPLHLRIVTAVVVVGLIAGGIAVVWGDMATRGGLLARGAASDEAARGGLPARPQQDTLTPAQASSSGLRLLSQAAAACQTVSYTGVQLSAGHGPDGSWASVVNVWHQRDRQTMVQAVTVPVTLPRPLGQSARTVPVDGDADDPVDLRDPEGVLGMTPELVALLAVNYRASLGGQSWVAGRLTREVVLRHANGTLAARFWLDSATKLPLRRQTFDTTSREVSEDTFMTLHLGSTAVARAPVTASMPRTRPLGNARLVQLRTAGWPLPGQLPGGLTLVQANETGGSSAPVIDLAYSDGLSVISLFLQRGHLPAELSGWSEVAMRGQQVYAADPGERSVAWSAHGFVYTLIADAPDQTVDQVVSALPHSARAGFFERVGRGLGRLASWLNPFQ